MDNLERLRTITRGCSSDMHEPGEQEVTAEFGPTVKVLELANGQRLVVRPGLDNAFTDEMGDMGFWLVRSVGGVEKEREWFNLADIIALALQAWR